MKIHEFQAKQILREAGVAVPRGIVADTPQAAADAFDGLGGRLAVVKAQIHAGGRGKGTIADIPSSTACSWSAAAKRPKAAANLLGHRLVTIQTGPEGQVVRRVLVEEACQIARELYLGAVIDRRRAGRCSSPRQRRGHGHRARGRHDARAHLPRALRARRRPAAATRFASSAWQLGLAADAARSRRDVHAAICRVFVQRDCSLLEINPLVRHRRRPSCWPWTPR